MAPSRSRRVVKLSVVIPSKTRKRQDFFLERAILSIQGPIAIEIKVERDGTQAEAMNRGAESSDGDFLAFLEDDDYWKGGRVDAALEALKEADFCSSTQLEVTNTGEIIRINDFPTPSGWFMKRKVWEVVGPFNTAYRWHLDNDWLGRLRRTDFACVHLVESTAPESGAQCLYRPFLHQICKQMNSRLMRHGSPYPLIERQVHRDSGMALIASTLEYAQQSAEEMGRLKVTYGCAPI